MAEEEFAAWLSNLRESHPVKVNKALLEAKASIKHPERERFAALIAAYDPDAFDLDAINEALRKLR